MTVREVIALRKAGRFQEAIKLAEEDLNEDRNKWTCMSLFWVLRDYVLHVFLPNQDFVNAEKFLLKMEELLPDMMDEEGFGEKAYNSLLKQVLPDYDLIKNATELSKENPKQAYKQIVDKVGSDGRNISDKLHEGYAWIIYRYMKAEAACLTSVRVRELLRDYLALHNKRPSMVHSMILNFAVNFAKEHSDFSLYKFFLLWGVKNLRQEDYENGFYDGHDIPSLISRICRGIVDSVEDFDVTDFVARFSYSDHQSFGAAGRQKNVIEYLRQAMYWKLIELYKANRQKELWDTFDRYVNCYSKFGASAMHSEILQLAFRFMVKVDEWRFLPFVKAWGIDNFRLDDWKKTKGKEEEIYPSLVVKTAKKCFDILKSDQAQQKDLDIIKWLKELFYKILNHDEDCSWEIRNYAILCIWEKNMEEAVLYYKRLLSQMGEKFYLWSELAACVTDDNKVKTGLLLKSKALEKNEDFLGDIHLSLAKAWLDEGFDSFARKELDMYAKHRKMKGWVLGSGFEVLRKRLSDEAVSEEEPDVTSYIAAAEDYVYSDFDWHDFVCISRWERDGSRYCSFCDDKGGSFSVKLKRFPVLKDCVEGDVVGFRCYIGEKKTDGVSRFLGMKNNFVAAKTIIPFVAAKRKSAPWSVLPLEYGVIDYINEEKRVLHILTKNSRQLFYLYDKKKFVTDDFVKFRQYAKIHKGEVKNYVVDLSLCCKDEALQYMEKHLAVVDNVNENKHLFHFELEGNMLDGIVRYDQTDIRPAVGDFLWITYCVKRNKKGEKRLKILDIQRSDAENKKDIL